MKLNQLIFLLWFFLQALQVTGQSSSDWARDFENGKELYNLGKYDLAMEALESLTYQRSDNPYLPYGSFYYAMSAYKSGLNYLSKNMFLQIRERFPSWEKMEEVNYWLGLLYFDSEMVPEAISTLNAIDAKQDNLQEDIRNLKMHYLDQIQRTDSISELLTEFPEDKVLAEILASKISFQPIMNRDHDRLAELVEKYDLGEDKFKVLTPQRSPKKDSYNIAVMLPFMYQDVNGRRTISKNWVLELYEGIKMAAEELNQKGYNINVFAYDTRRDSLATARLMQLEEMKTMDLFIGPLFLKPLELVSAFSVLNKINMFNPLSYNSKVIGGNPYSYLVFPTSETQAMKAADFTVRNALFKRAFVFYGESQSDSLMANLYIEKLEENQFELPVVKQYSKQTAKEVFNFLTEKVEEVNDQGELIEEEFLIPVDSLDYIFVASDSDDGLLMANLIGAVEARANKVPIIGSENLLDASFLLPEQMERLNVHVISPKFVDWSTEKSRAFRSHYVDKTNSLPSRYSVVGYDVAQFLGEMLHNYGAYFQLFFDELGYENGVLLPGYKYLNSHDNQFVPIVKFEEAELKIVNDYLKFSETSTRN